MAGMCEVVDGHNGWLAESSMPNRTISGSHISSPYCILHDGIKRAKFMLGQTGKNSMRRGITFIYLLSTKRR